MICPTLSFTVARGRGFNKRTCCGCPRKEYKTQGFANFLASHTFVFVSLISKRRAGGTSIPQNVFWETLPRRHPQGHGQELACGAVLGVRGCGDAKDQVLREG